MRKEIFSVEAVESMALRDGISLEKELGCKNFWLSSDCVKVIDCLKSRNKSLADWHNT